MILKNNNHSVMPIVITLPVHQLLFFIFKIKIILISVIEMSQNSQKSTVLENNYKKKVPVGIFNAGKVIKQTKKEGTTLNIHTHTHHYRHQIPSEIIKYIFGAGKL